MVVWPTSRNKYVLGSLASFSGSDDSDLWAPPLTTQNGLAVQLTKIKVAGSIHGSDKNEKREKS